MKKYFFTACLLCIFLLSWCWNNTNIGEKTIGTWWNETTQKINNNQTLEDAIINYISENFSCNDWSKLFVNYTELWMKSLWDWIAEWYLNVNAEWFYIDESWNLNNSCGFGVPMKVTVSTEDWANYTVIDAVQARDWSEYDKSIREMFSEEAIDRLYNWNVEFVDGRTLLEQAEEYFWVNIIPKTKNNFECKFCDKLRYYNPTPEDDELLKETNELHYNYISENNWNNTIYFGSDWNFRAEWSWDAWEWDRTFGQDENTIIVLNNSIDHVYDRYIITNVDKNNLNTILEIIQRM